MTKEVVKMVVTGPVNAGKTTLIRHISDVPVVTTDEVATDEVANVKTHTTVAMDYGILHVDEHLELHLYGTPGQRRFSFMWDVLAIGAVGVIFLADSSDTQSVDEMKYIYHYFRDRVHSPAVVGVTKQDIDGSISAEEVSAHLEADDVPIICCDPRNKEDSKMLVLSLLEMIVQEQQTGQALEESDFF
jgi:hypothetical protein